MYIENIKIGNFGKLSQCEYDLKSGINLIEGRNESGKSTLCEFIKFVFYGLSNKQTDGEMSERKRHISWKSNDASGSVVLNTGDNRYRIERSMVAHGAGYKDNITVVDLSANSPVSGIKIPGEYFFGIPEEVFTHTVYIRQSEGASFSGESIGQAVENIFYSADESVNTDKALKKLDEARVQIKHKKNTGRGLLDLLEKERDELSVRLADARQANELILQNEASLRNTVLSIEKNKRDCEKMAGQMRKTELYELLVKFDDRKKYKDNTENYKNGKREIITATTFNGFFPDDVYADEVEKAKSELLFLKKEVDSFEGIQEKSNEKEYSKELAETIKEQGGKKTIFDNLAVIRGRKKTLAVSAVVFGVIAVVAAIFNFVLKTKAENAAAVLLLFGLVAAVCSIVCLVMSLRNAGRINSVFETFSAENEEMLFDVISHIEECERYEIQQREMRNYREQKKAEAENRLSESIDGCLVLLGKWGVVPEERTYDAVVKSIDDVLADISEITSNIALYDKEIEKNEAVLAVIQGQISGYDEGEIRAEFESIEFDIDPENINETKKRYDFTVRAKDALTSRLTELEKSIAELKAKTDKPADLDSRLKIVKEKIEDLSLKHDAYVLAYEKLQSAGNTLRGKLAPGLSSAAGRLMGGLTDGKYKEIGVSDSLDMTYTFEEEGAVYTKHIDHVSSGTKDIAYVSLRLALAELFSKSGQKLPIVFDEAFARLDDGRLINMLSVAQRYAENGSQAIILTSQTREAKLLNESGHAKGFNYICI